MKRVETTGDSSPELPLLRFFVIHHFQNSSSKHFCPAGIVSPARPPGLLPLPAGLERLRRLPRGLGQRPLGPPHGGSLAHAATLLPAIPRHGGCLQPGQHPVRHLLRALHGQLDSVIIV